MLVKIAVETDNFMARLKQHRNHDSADIAQVPSDQHAHDYFSFAIPAVLVPDSDDCRVSERPQPTFMATASRNGWNRLGEPPGHAALLDHVFQHLFVLQCVHRAPEALVLEGKELFGIDQPPEGFFDQLLALAHIVEDLRAKDKEAAIDPEIGILRGAYAVDFTAQHPSR